MIDINGKLDHYNIWQLGITSVIKAKINQAIYVLVHSLFLLQLYFGAYNNKMPAWWLMLTKYMVVQWPVISTPSIYYVTLACVSIVIALTFLIFFLCGYLFLQFAANAMKQDIVNSLNGWVFFLHFTILRIPITSILFFPILGNYYQLDSTPYMNAIMIIISLLLLGIYMYYIFYTSIFTEAIYPRSKFYLHGHSKLTRILYISRSIIYSLNAVTTGFTSLFSFFEIVNEIALFIEHYYSNICRWRFSVYLTTISISVGFWQNMILILLDLTGYSYNINILILGISLIAITAILIDILLTTHNIEISQSNYRNLSKRGLTIYLNNIIIAFMKYNLSTRNKAILFNFLQFHCHRCKNDKCECINCSEWVYNSCSKLSASREIFEQKVFMGEIKNQWINLLDMMFCLLIKEVGMKLESIYMYSCFLKIFVKNYYKAYSQIMKCLDIKGNGIQKILLTTQLARLKYAIQKYEKSTKIINIDVISLLNFENKTYRFKNSLIEFTQMSHECCDRIITSLSYIKPLLLLSGKLLNVMLTIQSLYDAIIKIYPEHIETHIAYGEFLFLVTNDSFTSSSIFEKVSQIEGVHIFGRRFNMDGEIEYFSFISIGIAIISTQSNSFGTIAFCNRYCLEIFEREYEEIINHNISILIPQLFANIHDKRVENFLESGKSSFIGRISLVVGLLKCGMIAPLLLTLKTVPTYSNRMYIIGFFINNKNIIYKKLKGVPLDMLKEKLAIVLLNSDYQIEGMCKKFIKMIGFTKHFKIHDNTFNESVPFETICPEFDKEIESKQQNIALAVKNIIQFINTDSISNAFLIEQMQMIKSSPDKIVSMCSTSYELSCDLKYYLIFVVYKECNSFSKKEIKESVSNYVFEKDSITSANSGSSYKTGTIKNRCYSTYQPMFLRGLRYAMIIKFIIILVMMMLTDFLPLVRVSDVYLMYELSYNIMQTGILQSQISNMLMMEINAESHMIARSIVGWKEYSSNYTLALLNEYRNCQYKSNKRLIEYKITSPDIFEKSILGYEINNHDISRRNMSLATFQSLFVSKALNLITNLPFLINTTMYGNGSSVYSDMDENNYDALWLVLNTNTYTLDGYSNCLAYFSMDIASRIGGLCNFVEIMSSIGALNCLLLFIILIPIIVKVQSLQKKIVTSISKIRKSQLMFMKENYNKFIKKSTYFYEKRSSTSLSIFSSKKLIKDLHMELEKELKEEDIFLNSQRIKISKVSITYMHVISTIAILIGLLIFLCFTGILTLNGKLNDLSAILTASIHRISRNYYSQSIVAIQQRELTTSGMKGIGRSVIDSYYSNLSDVNNEILLFNSLNQTILNFPLSPSITGSFCDSIRSHIYDKLYEMCLKYDGGGLNQGIQYTYNKETEFIAITQQIINTSSNVQLKYLGSEEYISRLILSTYFLQPFLKLSDEEQMRSIVDSIGELSIYFYLQLCFWLVLGSIIYVLLYSTVMRWFVRGIDILKGLLIIMPEDTIKQINENGILNSPLLK